MRREELFNRSGYYRFLLDSNSLLHREAAAVAIDALNPLLKERASDEPVRVLDLACGGWPTAIAGVMAAFASRTFEYTVIDINPDQVELASTRFEFPENVNATHILEGNAWDLETAGVEPGFDLVFSGLDLVELRLPGLFLVRFVFPGFCSLVFLFTHLSVTPRFVYRKRRSFLRVCNCRKKYRICRVSSGGSW